MMKKITMTCVALGLWSLWFFLSPLYANSQQNTGAFTEDLDTDDLVELVSTKHYKTPDAKDVQKHVQSITDFNDYLRTLDNYSTYLSPEQVAYKSARKTLPRKGIGFDIIEHDGKLLVIPLKNEALYRAGLTAPHYLKAINGKPIVFSDFDSYRFLSTMKIGKRYTVEVEPNSFVDAKSNAYEVAVKQTRRASSLHYTRKKGKARLLGIREFVRDTEPYIKNFFKKNKNIDHLVIDLRHSIGGSPHIAVDVLSYFVGKDKNVVSYRSKAEKVGKEKKARQGKTFAVPYRLKDSTQLTLLMSEFTASSAELFAHALKHYRDDIVIIGKPSAGKCLAQKPFFFDHGKAGALVLSTYELVMPDETQCDSRPLAVDTALGQIELMPVDDIFKAVLAMDKNKD